MSWLDFLLVTITSISLLIPVTALLQVASDISNKSHQSDEAVVAGWRLGVKWADVILREVPGANVLYQSLYNWLLDTWETYLSRQTYAITDVKLMTLPSPLLNDSLADDTRPVFVHSLMDAWRAQSKLLGQSGRGKERVWVFTPSQDYLIQYSVKNSLLPFAFIAFYPKGELAMFPPEPFRAYWNTSRFSRITAALWLSQPETPVLSTLIQLVQQCAGPHQMLSTDVDVANSDHGHRGPHSWSWEKWVRAFPHVFRPPAPSQLNRATTIASTGAGGEISAAERRRRARLQDLGASPSNGSALVVIRANQSQTLITT